MLFLLSCSLTDSWSIVFLCAKGREIVWPIMTDHDLQKGSHRKELYPDISWQNLLHRHCLHWGSDERDTARLFTWQISYTESIWFTVRNVCFQNLLSLLWNPNRLYAKNTVSDFCGFCVELVYCSSMKKFYKKSGCIAVFFRRVWSKLGGHTRLNEQSGLFGIYSLHQPMWPLLEISEMLMYQVKVCIEW
jgi:hypothetical protein